MTIRSIICSLCLSLLYTKASAIDYSSLSPKKNWLYKEVADISSSRYLLYKDTIKNELCASYYSNLEESAKAIKVPSKISYEGKTYIVRDVDMDYTGGGQNVESVSLPTTVVSIDHLLCPALSQIKIPSSTTYIGSEAFSGCNSFISIEIPNSVIYIGDGAFANCEKLESVILPRSLKGIGKRTFQNCANLQTVKWSKEHKPVRYADLSSDERNNLMKVIPPYLFDGCTSLGINETIEFPYPIETISEFAFNGCEKLKSIVIPIWGKLNCIDKAAFQNCKSLQTLRLTNTGAVDTGTSTILAADTISDNAFHGCEKLVIDWLSTKYIGNNAFMSCKSLTTISLMNTEEISDKAFALCSSLNKVYLPNTVNHIGSECFFHDESLRNIEGLNSAINFGGAIQGIFSLTKINYQPLLRSFKYNALSFVKSNIEKWQQKKEYETTAQWKSRVTEKTREEKIKSLTDKARENYIKEYSPKQFSCTIEEYDADEEVYKLKSNNFSSHFYVKVPLNEAQYFKEHIESAVKEPLYCIKNDYIDIASCTFNLNGKKYTSPTIYHDDESANIALDLSPLDLYLGEEGKDNFAIDEVDTKIPICKETNSKCFVVIIGNEKYSKVAPVSYANNDATIFAQYCNKTLGIPAKNIRSYINATYATMMTSLKDIKQISEAYKGDINVIFYYAGHGVPNESNHNAYLLPVDVDGAQTELCLPISKLYQELNDLKANHTVVFMDACFSGAQRGNGMLTNARSVALKVKNDTPQGNMVVFTAATGDQTAFPYIEKHHGMFTYFLLKKLQETSGEATLSEIGNYISEQVSQQVAIQKGRKQTPLTIPSATYSGNWKETKLK